MARAGISRNDQQILDHIALATEAESTTLGVHPATLTEAGSPYTVTLSAADASDVQFDIIVSEAAPQPVALGSNIPGRSALLNHSFSFNVASYFTGDLSRTYAVTSGTLPAGVTFSDGVFSGSASALESQNIEVTATDSNSNQAVSNVFTITVVDLVVGEGGILRSPLRESPVGLVRGSY